MAAAAVSVAASGAVPVPPVPEPEVSFMAPLATEAMLLDSIAVDGRIVVAGERGIVLVSDDAGESWRQSQTPTRSTLTGVYFVDRDTGWVVGHDAVILRTTDGGASWVELYFDPDDQRPLFDVWFADADRGFAIGAYGLFMQTSDGGQSWDVGELVPEPWRGDDAGDEQDGDWAEDDVFYDYHLNHIVAADGRLYIAAEAGNFFRSDDGGDTWYSMPTIYEGSYFCTLPLPGDELLLMGLRGNMFRSPDGGVTWEEVSTPVEVLLNHAIVLDDGTILVAGMAGALLESNDGGRSFRLHQQPDRKGIATLMALPGGAIVAAGEAGVSRLTREQYATGSDS